MSKNLSRKSNKAPLGEYIVGEPMERVPFDILGKLPTTDSGNKYVLVISDCFTRWTECVPLPDQEAETVARAFVDNFVCRFGTPLQLHTDQGRNFESQLFSELCKYLDIQKTRTTSLRPQANGLVERFNRTLISMLKSYCSKNQTDWDVYLPQVMMAYRSSIHSTTKLSPNKMLLGHEIRLPLSAIIGCPISSKAYKSNEDYVDDLKETLVSVHEFARKHVKKTANYQKKHYDSNAKVRKFKKGQCVWLHNPSRKKNVCSKLSMKWKGPFLVTDVLDDLVCLVKMSAKKKPKAIHIDRLCLYGGKNVPSWINTELKQL